MKTTEITGDIKCLLLKSMNSVETPACPYHSQGHQSHLPFSGFDWHVNANRARSEGNNCRSLICSLSCCITQRHWLPSECDYHGVQRITSTVRSPLSPVFLFTYLKSAFSRSVSVWFTLTLSLTISLPYLPYPPSCPSFTRRNTSRAGCLLTQKPWGT